MIELRAADVIRAVQVAGSLSRVGIAAALGAGEDDRRRLERLLQRMRAKGLLVWEGRRWWVPGLAPRACTRCGGSGREPAKRGPGRPRKSASLEEQAGVEPRRKSASLGAEREGWGG